jgi:hypothetical protein
MKKIIPTLFLAFGLCIGFAQTPDKPVTIKRTTVYFEALGQGLYNTLGVDKLYNVDRRVKTSFSKGITIIPHPELLVLGLPLSYNYIFGQKNHHLETGIGFTIMYLRSGRINAQENYYDDNGNWQHNEFKGHQNDWYTYFTPRLSYRFQKPEGGFFWRLSFTPPVAGINHLGGIRGGHYKWGGHNEYFTSAAFFGSRIYPWAGISIGYTLKCTCTHSCPAKCG